MTARDEILAAATAVLRRKGRDAFTLQEILTEMHGHGTRYADNTIRTHVNSRMCANSPDHHGRTYDDFERSASAPGFTVYATRHRTGSHTAGRSPAPRDRCIRTTTGVTRGLACPACRCSRISPPAVLCWVRSPQTLAPPVRRSPRRAGSRGLARGPDLPPSGQQLGHRPAVCRPVGDVSWRAESQYDNGAPTCSPAPNLGVPRLILEAKFDHVIIDRQLSGYLQGWTARARARTGSCCCLPAHPGGLPTEITHQWLMIIAGVIDASHVSESRIAGGTRPETMSRDC